MGRRASSIAGLLVALLLAACSGTRAPPPVPGAAVAAPAAGDSLRLDPGATTVRVLVYRDGPLAAVGHNHVITASDLEGSVAPAADGEYAFDLRLPVAAFVVDDPAARAAAGADFVSAVDDEARAGTRANLLGERLLYATRFPAIGLAGCTLTGPDGARSLAVAVTVRDVTRDFRVPVTVEGTARGPILRGELRVRHGDLGLAPFSVMGGMLRVRDELRIAFSAGLAPPG